MPSRTTKVSEKLVLLPETDTKDDDAEDEIESETVLARRLQEDEQRPLKDEEIDVLRKRGGVRGKSYAERLPKVQRTEKVSRVTAYCTAQAYKIKPTAEFLRKKHEAKTKLYDDCLYVIYALPLLNGTEGYRVRSRPILKTPGTGKTVLDLEIERSERRDHHEGYFDDDAYTNAESPEPEDQRRGRDIPMTFNDPSPEDQYPSNPFQGADDRTSQMNRLAPEAKKFAEMFVFSYGVVVFWNFTERQEKDILADLTFADAEDDPSLLTRPLEEDDFETEEFHFEYSADVKRPRVFNDMITLLPRSDHMIKLTISHAIAQSTKLCFFEERMGETMSDAQHVPKTLALTGELNMTRTEIVKILGRLFKSRVDINLCKPNDQAWSSSSVLTNPSIKHSRRSQLLLGLGTHPPPSLCCHPRIPRDRPPHQSPQRALPRFPRPRRDPLRLRRRFQDERHHMDHHHPHHRQYPRNRHGGHPPLRNARKEQERREEVARRTSRRCRRRCKMDAQEARQRRYCGICTAATVTSDPWTAQRSGRPGEGARSCRGRESRRREAGDLGSETG